MASWPLASLSFSRDQISCSQTCLCEILASMPRLTVCLLRREGLAGRWAARNAQRYQGIAKSPSGQYIGTLLGGIPKELTAAT